MSRGTLRMLVENSGRAIREGIYDTGYNLSGVGGFEQVLHPRSGAAIISEVKFASPSQGPIRENVDPESVAAEMVSGGAAAISVLTQPYLFGGSPEYLARVRQAVQVPILMKDIIISPVQVDAARDLGADCVLLIQAVFDANLAEGRDRLISRAHRHGIRVLLEVHNRAELKSAQESACDIIGVNNRNLDTLKISLETTRDVLYGYEDPRLAISESGIESGDHIRYLKRCGADAFLVGSSIMRKGNIKESVKNLVLSL